jgi:hypothetical protein
VHPGLHMGNQHHKIKKILLLSIKKFIYMRHKKQLKNKQILSKNQQEQNQLTKIKLIKFLYIDDNIICIS